MSSAGGDDPFPADQLAALDADTVMVSEAPPDPPPGPARTALTQRAQNRLDHAALLMDTAVRGYLDRLAGRTRARLQGPRARRGTRWWSDQVKSGDGRGVMVADPPITGVERKSLDADYVLPPDPEELAGALRPVGLRIVADTAADVARELGAPGLGPLGLDWNAVRDAVDSVVGHMLDIGERHAADIRREILDADATAQDLDDVIDRVLEAVRRGGRWLLLAGRTLATALAGDAALAAAAAAGVSTTQWISRRDGRVRLTHVAADGQIRPIGERFEVGRVRLRHPADPTVLPEGLPEIINCRCALFWMPEDPARIAALHLARNGTASGAARRLVDAVAAAPEAARVPADVVGYRTLSAPVPVTPGQRVSWATPLVLALSPAVVAGVGLVVALSAGTTVAAAAGGVALPAGTTLEVLSATSEQIVARPVMEP